MYDNNNIFAKIIRKEIPCNSVYEDEKVLFFYDVNPQAKIHIIGIPKTKVINLREFIDSSEKEMVIYFFEKVNEIIKKGRKKISQKVGEESMELIVDFLNGSKKRTIEEAADLIYHLLVLLYSKKITIKDIKKELVKRKSVRR